MSDEDIEKGSQWFSDVEKHLDAARFGIICLTPDNLDSRWMMFESGALWKAIEEQFLCPYLFNLKSTQLKPPLSQFQAAVADRKNTQELVRSINRRQEPPLSDSRIKKSFEKWWPELEKALKGITPAPPKKSVARSERELLEEILTTVRGISRSEVTTPVSGSRFIPWSRKQEPLHSDDRFKHAMEWLASHDRPVTVTTPSLDWQGAAEQVFEEAVKRQWRESAPDKPEPQPAKSPKKDPKRGSKK
jgi:hypothetical protein